MSADIQKYVVECDLCQRNKNENVSTPGLLHPLHIPNKKWEEISMDFIEGLPISEEKDKILVVVDKLTKYAHFIGVRKIDSTKQRAEIFFKNIYKLHGFPKFIVNDIDAKFKGNFWREFFKQIRTSLNMSSTYHPQTDVLAQILARWCFLLVSGPRCKCIKVGFENRSSVFYSKAATMSTECSPQKKPISGLKSSERALCLSMARIHKWGRSMTIG
jgi:hypothetical protein